MTFNDKISALREYARENGGALRKLEYRKYNGKSVYAIYRYGLRITCVDTIQNLYSRMILSNLIEEDL